MQLKLTRLDVTDHGIFGKLETEGFSCVTLERHDICIPTGDYKITLYDSPEHGTIPLLHDVPGRSWIEIHEGNFEHTSKGCILVGRTRTIIEGADAISASRDTLKQLVQLLQQCREAVDISIC